MPSSMHAKETEARAVMVILGFKGVNDFAARAGVNHETAANLLGTSDARYGRKRHRIVIQVHEALHTAYLDCKAELGSGTRAFVRDWAKRWKKFVLAEKLWLESPGKQRVQHGDAVRQRELLQSKVKAEVVKVFSDLRWD